MRILRFLATCLIVVFLAGCKTSLYSGLNQQEANEMLALLLNAGISAEKVEVKDSVQLLVATDEVSRAVSLLKEQGLPREKFSSIQDIFPKDSLISSPTEERARYIFALSQGLSKTLTEIDGVIRARVHIVMPEKSSGRKQQEVADPSASVFIKYNQQQPLDRFIPQVKSLVSASIEGLSYDQVTVLMFPSLASQEPMGTVDGEPGLAVHQAQSQTRYRIVIAVLFLLLTSVTGAGIWFWFKGKKVPTADAVALSKDTATSGS